MSVSIEEVSTSIESVAERGGDSGGSGEGPGGAFEVQIEELRPLVRALVAEELERWLRQGRGWRGDFP